MIFMVFFWVPAAALLWLALVSHGRKSKRVAAVAVAMLTVVGSIAAPRLALDDLSGFKIANVREGLALAAAGSGSVYLFFWTQVHRGRGRNRTLSYIAAIIGLVPFVAAIAVALIY